MTRIDNLRSTKLSRVPLRTKDGRISKPTTISDSSFQARRALLLSARLPLACCPNKFPRRPGTCAASYNERTSRANKGAACKEQSEPALENGLCKSAGALGGFMRVGLALFARPSFLKTYLPCDRRRCNKQDDALLNARCEVPSLSEGPRSCDSIPRRRTPVILNVAINAIPIESSNFRAGNPAGTKGGGTEGGSIRVKRAGAASTRSETVKRKFRQKRSRDRPTLLVHLG